MEGTNVIYRIVNLIGGKSYIGKAKNLSKRLKKHQRESRKKESPLYSAIRKHGWDNFKVEIVEFANRYEDLDSLEIAAIEKFKTLYPEGYNLTKGGTGGDVVTNHPNRETLYENRKGRIPWNKGLKGATVAWNKGTKGVMKPNKTTFKPGAEHPFYGRKQTIETQMKKKLNTDYRKRSENFPWEEKSRKCMKPVLQILLDGTVREWESATTASRELAIAKHLIFQYLDKPKPLNNSFWKRKK